MDQPIGLQKLAALDCLEVHSILSWRIGVQYEIRECSGELLYSAKRERRGLLSFDITLLDVNGVEVITMHRPGTFGMSRLKMGIEGALASIVRQKATCLRPVFEVHNADDTPAYKIKGLRGKCTELKFELTTLDKKPLGAITRKWAGWRKELSSNRDVFVITFPEDLELQYKAACIGTCMHIIDVRRRK